MAPRIRPLTPGELSADQRALYDAITGGPRAQGPQHFALTRRDGSLRGPFDADAALPRGRRAPSRSSAPRSATAPAFTDRMRELAILLVAARWDSAFERESHEAIARAHRVQRRTSSPRSARRTSPAFAGDEAHRRQRRHRPAGRRPRRRALGCGIRRPRRRRRLRTHRARRLLLDARPAAAGVPCRG